MGESQNYEVVRRLAVGGMAEIFLATQRLHEGVRRRVVIKRIAVEHASEQAFVDSFFNEARLSAHLVHPNIAQIYDLATDNNTYCIVMEYVPGLDLSNIIKAQLAGKVFMPVSIALHIIHDVCVALAYAHAATDENGHPLGIIHRDANPSNIIVSQTGQTKLVDFGIAKAQAIVSKRTETGVIRGKLHYLSPEQVSGGSVDQRIDIFAVGVSLYELLTNKNPFDHGDSFQALHRIMIGQYEKLQAVRPAVGPAIAALVARAMAHERNERFVSAAAFAEAIEQTTVSEGLTTFDNDVRRYMEQFADWERVQTVVETPNDAATIELHTLSPDASVLAIQRPAATFGQKRKKSASAYWWAAPIAAIVLGAIAMRTLVSERRATLDAPLALVNRFEVTTDPPGAEVVFDHVLRSGRTPLTIDGVDVKRRYALELHRPGSRDIRSEVSLDAPGAQRVSFQLEPLAPSPAPRSVPHNAPTASKLPAAAAPVVGIGTLRVIVNPWGSVSIDGRRVGDTPFPIQEVPAGEHVLVIENPELHQRVTKNVTVVANKEIVVSHDFLKE